MFRGEKNESGFLCSLKKVVQKAKNVNVPPIKDEINIIDMELSLQRTPKKEKDKKNSFGLYCSLQQTKKSLSFI